MALGDELARNDRTTVEGPMSISNVTSDVEVEELGDQAGGREAEKVEGAPVEELDTGNSLARAARQERGEVPPDDNQTPPGAASPEEGQQLGDAVKKVFEAIQTPGAQQALQQMGLNISGAAEGGGGAQAASGGQQTQQQASQQQASQQQGGQTVPAAPVEQVPTPSLSETISEATPEQIQAPQQTTQQQGGGGGGQQQGGGGQSLLANRDLQRALIAFGQQISPGDQNQIGQLGNQLISNQAQAEFRERLARGESPGEAAAQTQGLTPQGQQSVLQQFRAERQREAEREATETEQQLTQEQIEQRRREAETETELTERELALQEQELEEQTDLEQQQLELAQRDQDLQEEMQNIERDLSRSRAELNRARAEDLMSDDSNDREQLRRATEVGQIAGRRAEQIQSELQSVSGQLRDTVQGLPTDTSNWPFAGKNVQEMFVQLQNEAENSDRSLNEVAQERLQDVPEGSRADFQQALQLEARRRGLRENLDQVSRVQNRANEVVMAAFGQGSGQGQTQTQGQGQQTQREVKSFNSIEEAKGNVAPGDTIEIGGRRFRAEMGDDGNIKGVPIQ